jgi:dTDP-glucose 4,6-dehydratase
MKILVTGGAGFIAHHVIEYLLENTDADIISLDRLDTSGNLSRLNTILNINPQWTKRLKVVWHDLKAPISDFNCKLIGNDITHILHFAAASHVDRSVLYPMEFVLDNVVGTCNILDFARLNCKNLKLFLYFSTDEIFGSAPIGIKYKEDDRYRSSNPYSASKAGGEELCVAYENTYNIPVIITHTMNVYGERQHPEKYIPIIINKLLKNEELEIHSNPEQTEAGKRHYLHAKDVASAVHFLINNHTIGQKYNIVANEESDNLQLALKIAKIMNKQLKYKLVDPKITRPRHDFRYSLCGQKLKNMGWQQKISLDQGLESTINWFLKNKLGE